MHDYHMHCRFCRHATGRVEEYARTAVAQGLQEICLTPHIPLPGYRPGFFGDRLRMDAEEFPRYIEELEKARARVPGLTILSGIEADYIAGTEEYVERFLSSYPFDYVLMSVHFIAEWPPDQWVFDLSRDARPLERIYDDYLHAVRKGIDTGLFDCLAHLDLIKQEGKPLLATHRSEVEEIVARCRDRGMSAEINTSGLRREISECYPANEIVTLMRDMRLPLIPGSDAHAPAQVAFGFDRLRAVRFVRYRGRRMVEGAA
jgi:histidinol-phosphatase (PHP family)